MRCCVKADKIGISIDPRLSDRGGAKHASWSQEGAGQGRRWTDALQSQGRPLSNASMRREIVSSKALRHIEVQGLWRRDPKPCICLNAMLASARHQKVTTGGPAPVMTPRCASDVHARSRRQQSVMPVRHNSIHRRRSGLNDGFFHGDTPFAVEHPVTEHTGHRSFLVHGSAGARGEGAVAAGLTSIRARVRAAALMRDGKGFLPATGTLDPFAVTPAFVPQRVAQRTISPFY